MNKYYLYRWIRLDKNEPFYIGIGTKTKEDILYGTYKRANAIKRNNTIWNNIKSKSEYIVQIVLESDDYEFIKQKEIEFIKLYGRIDIQTGCLANMTDGGEGTTNVIVSENSRTLRSLNRRGKSMSEESILKRTMSRQANYIMSEETKSKISNSKVKKISQFSLTGVFIRTWNSAKDAAVALNISRETICQCANRKNTKVFTAGNFIWSYECDQFSSYESKAYQSLLRVKSGKVRRNITDQEKEQIVDEYIKINNTFIKKIDKLKYLSNKYQIKFSTIRAIVYNL